MCLTGALSLEVMLAYFSLERRAINWLAFCMHLAGVGVAIVIIVLWSSSNEYALNASLSNSIHSNIVGHILPSHDLAAAMPRELSNRTMPRCDASRSIEFNNNLRDVLDEATGFGLHAGGANNRNWNFSRAAQSSCVQFTKPFKSQVC
jgi:hypothetical protein